MKHDDERPRPVGCEEIARDRASWGRRRRGVRAPDRGGSGRGEPGGAPPRGRERRSERRDIEEAAVDLMRRRGREILATARRYAATPDDAEDAYQRGLEILLTKAPTSNEEELVPWLKTVVIRTTCLLRHADSAPPGRAPAAKRSLAPQRHASPHRAGRTPLRAPWPMVGTWPEFVLLDTCWVEADNRGGSGAGGSVTRIGRPGQQHATGDAPVESRRGRPGTCPRCGAARTGARWCELCGLDVQPDAVRPPNALSYAAQRREQRWLGEDAARQTSETKQDPPPPTQTDESRARERMNLALRLRSTPQFVGEEEAKMRGLIDQAAQTQSAVPLVAALEHPLASMREGAAVALGALGDTQAVAPLTAALGDRDGRVRAAAFSSRVRIEPERAMELALEALRDVDPEVRVGAVMVLARASPPEAAGEALVEALADRDALVRGRAARELGARGDRRAVGSLTALLKRESPGSRTQEAAADALERLGAGRRVTRQRSRLASPLVLWAVGMALFALGVVLANTTGMGAVVGMVGVAGFVIMLGARVRGVGWQRQDGHFWLGDGVAGGDAVWLGSAADGGWNLGGGDIGSGDFGGGGGDGGGGW
jgi:HEAT repeat protein